MASAIIIGRGPAGVSAALYLRRAGIETQIIGKDGGALAKTDRIENYYGFAEPISGEKLLGDGLQNAVRLGCILIEEEVVSITWNGSYQVYTTSGSYSADVVVLATGAARSTPKIPGILELEGKGVSYCAVCDAFFYRGKAVAVLGNGDYALHEAAELLPVAGSVTLLTNGAPLPGRLLEGLLTDTRPITKLQDTAGKLSGVTFADGEPLALAGLFVAAGVASSADLARKLGAETEATRIIVNERMETNLPGLYAAGDCTGGLLQIAKAVGEGAVAGTQAVQYLRKLAK